jgi:hypothetical protein
MIKIGIVLGREVEPTFQQQRRHPMRIVPINSKRQTMEVAPMGARLHLNYLHDLPSRSAFSGTHISYKLCLQPSGIRIRPLLNAFPLLDRPRKDP